ncbi:heavy-metal-associated domain-containing protein [Pedobacter caeni]|uniref:Heavy-metal-associated domain-containing protein n=1 Tax=Pedobacter caeni TaxID=288992 RepID=A0A1M5LFH1_9SPHI|nr:heavy-metal-associated domain-containing protein [Pedobacter caeni]SHG63439.1 Heavy-metal-associated domain-containing protein [Pedobacter caeni]
MKSLRFFSVVVLTFLSITVFAQSKIDSIKVRGNCTMCKKKIETALKVPGVSAASWSPETKVLKVSYDSTVISNDQIQQKVAAAGYDTQKFKATDEAYNKLHSCCQYEREGEEKLPVKGQKKH